MAQLKKFMFDTDFDLEEVELPPEHEEVETTESEAEEEPEFIAPTFSEDELNVAKQAAYAEGKQEGLSESKLGLESKISQTVETLSDKLDRVVVEQEQANEQLLSKALGLATSLVRKLFPAYTSAHGAAEVEAMTNQVVGGLVGAPKIIVRVNESLVEQINTALLDHLTTSGYEGVLNVVGDADVGMGDCRIEWDTGHAERAMNNVWQDIDTIVERNLGTDEISHGTDTPQPLDPDPTDVQSDEVQETSDTPDTEPGQEDPQVPDEPA